MRYLGQSRLTIRILFWVVCASLLMFSLVTAVTVWQQRERMYRASQEDADRNVARSIGAISIALWNFDRITMDATLSALTQSGSIFRAEVRARQQLFAEIERSGPGTRADHEWEIPIMGPDNSKQIGALKISESYADVSKVFAANLLIELVSELTKIGGLAALLFIIIYRVVARHLQSMAHEVSNLGPGNVLTPIGLQRKKVWRDELDTLVDSINRFRTERAEAEEAMHRDIAERLRVEAVLNKTERDLSEALEIAQLAYWEYDLTSREFVLNDQFYSLCQTSAGQVGGHRLKADDFFRMLVHREDALAFAAYIEQALQASRSDRFRIEVRIVSAGRPTHWMRVHCKAERDNADEGARLIGAIQDITQRKLAEDALWATRSELARVTRLTTLGQIGASIAHEINQPLGAIVANANAVSCLLDGTPTDLDEVRIALKEIVDDGHRASAVVENVRAMFKKDSHRRVLSDVNVIVRDVLTMVDADLRAQRVCVSTDLREELPKILADRVQLQQLFLNLIMNAIEAMSSVTDRARLLRIRSEIGESSSILVTLEDSGTGIEIKDTELLFDAFFTTKSAGMGMGLSICRSIVNAHDGRIRASPGVTCGSVFHVAFRYGAER
jgi:PAS domain S-box-containing protein